MNVEETGLEVRAARHAALGDPTRLRIVDLLALADRTPGDLMRELGIPSNLLAHHLGALEGVGLIARRRSEGDRRRSYVRLLPQAGDDRPAPAALLAPRVLFVCTGNSSRSPLAVALWARASTVPAESAGTHPATRTSAGALAAAARHGLSLDAHAPVPVESVLRPDDVVITVCDRAREELGPLVALHWSVPNPGPVGTERAYDEACEDLGRRVARLAPRLRAA